MRLLSNIIPLASSCFTGLLSPCLKAPQAITRDNSYALEHSRFQNVENRRSGLLAAVGNFIPPASKIVHDISPWSRSEDITETVTAVTNPGFSPLQWGAIVVGSALVLGGLGVVLWWRGRSTSEGETSEALIVAPKQVEPDRSDQSDVPDTKIHIGADSGLLPLSDIFTKVGQTGLGRRPRKPRRVPLAGATTHRALLPVTDNVREFMKDQAWRERGVKVILTLRANLSDIEQNIQHPYIADLVGTQIAALSHMIEAGFTKMDVYWAVKIVLSLLEVYSPRDAIQISRRGYALTRVENAYRQLFCDNEKGIEIKEWFFFPALHYAEEVQTRICNAFMVEGRTRWQEALLPFVQPEFAAQFNSLLYMTGNDVVDRMEDIKTAEATLLDLQTALEDVQNDLRKTGLQDNELAQSIQGLLGMVKMMQAYLYRCSIQKAISSS
jgi:hypothetical protein